MRISYVPVSGDTKQEKECELDLWTAERNWKDGPERNQELGRAIRYRVCDHHAPGLQEPCGPLADDDGRWSSFWWVMTTKEQVAKHGLSQGGKTS